MSKSHELQQHISQLEDIRSILNAMKNLAFMTVHKLTRCQQLQSQIVDHIKYTADNFLTAYPKFIDHSHHQQLIYVLVGSERGFCGDFNERLLENLKTTSCTGIIAIGNRLLARLDAYPYPIIASLAGANAKEEVPLLLEALFNQLQRLAANTELIALYHDPDSNQIQQRQILPAFTDAKAQNAYPPLLNVSPTLFFTELLEQYLLAIWQHILFASLLAENRYRLQHLEAAVQHLDDHTQKLYRKAQTYRQEEITEEIEVILLTENM